MPGKRCRLSDSTQYPRPVKRVRLSAPSEATYNSTPFLDLPAELRLAIYEVLFDESVRDVFDPWQALPQHSRFRSFASLALVNRLVHHESTSLLAKHYSHKMCFYFEDALDLYLFQQRYQCNRVLRDAHFCMRFHKSCFGEHGSSLDCEHGPVSTADLVLAQPGLSEGLEWWENTSSLFFKLPVAAFAYRLPQLMKYGFQFLDAFEHGRDLHTLLWPLTSNGLQLRTLGHLRHECSTPSQRYLRTMTMDGRLQDVSFEGLDMYKHITDRWHMLNTRPQWASPSPDLDEEEREEYEDDSWIGDDGSPQVSDEESVSSEEGKL